MECDSKERHNVGTIKGKIDSRKTEIWKLMGKLYLMVKSILCTFEGGGGG